MITNRTNTSSDKFRAQTVRLSNTSSRRRETFDPISNENDSNKKLDLTLENKIKPLNSTPGDSYVFSALFSSFLLHVFDAVCVLCLCKCHYRKSIRNFIYNEKSSYIEKRNTCREFLVLIVADSNKFHHRHQCQHHKHRII